MGLMLHRRGVLSSAAAGGFTPADLFASGEAGAYYDPSDLSTLWKDTAGTDAVTADGDAVARMDDKSGNGNHVTQETAASRPVYKTAGGLHWLFTDGVDDFYRIGVAFNLGAMFAGIRLINTGSAADYYVDTRNSSGPNGYVFNNETDTGPIGPYWDEKRKNGVAGSYNGGDLWTTTNIVFGLRRTGVIESGQVDLWQRFNGIERGTGRLFTYVVIDRDLTAQEISDTESFCADKAGVTL